MNIGSKYDEFKKEALRVEFESQLERKISSEGDFMQACSDYLKLKALKNSMPPARYEGSILACYSCCDTASNPRTVVVDDVAVWFHQSCIYKEALRCIIPRLLVSQSNSEDN